MAETIIPRPAPTLWDTVPAAPPVQPVGRMVPVTWGTWPAPDAVLFVDRHIDEQWAYAGQMACGSDGRFLLVVPRDERSDPMTPRRVVAIERVSTILASSTSTSAAVSGVTAAVAKGYTKHGR